MESQELRLSTTYPSPLTDSMCGISISSLASPTLRRELLEIQVFSSQIRTVKLPGWKFQPAQGMDALCRRQLLSRVNTWNLPANVAGGEANLKLLMKHVTHHAATTVIRRMLRILAHIVCRHMQTKRNAAVCELAHTSDFILPAHGSLVR